MLEIDGAHGEGGGQLLRNAVALAAITGRAARVVNIRAGREKPGLAPQHLTAVRAVAALCGASVEGLELRSQHLSFVPGPLRGGEFDFEVGTAGSVVLVLQALLPVLISCGAAVAATVRGGTDVRAAPPLDYFEQVLLRWLAALGARVRLSVARRGYYPKGGGELRIEVEPARLHPLAAEAAGELQAIRGMAHVSHLPGHIPERMRRAALARFAGRAEPVPRIDIRVLGHPDALGQGGAVVLWAHTGNGVLGAGRVAERGVPAERLGEEAAGELIEDLSAGVALDVHAADQLPIYLALAGRRSSFTTRELSRHAETTLWLLEQFLPVRCAVTRQARRARVEIVAQPPG